MGTGRIRPAPLALNHAPVPLPGGAPSASPPSARSVLLARNGGVW